MPTYRPILALLAPAAVVIALTGSTSSCEAQQQAQQAQQAHSAPGKKVLMPAHSCTRVIHRGGGETTDCAPSLGNPRHYPPYPDVPHGRGDTVQHKRYPAEWMVDSDAASAESAREAAASGAWG